MQGPVAFWMKATGPRFLLRVKLPAEGRRVVKVPQALPQHVVAPVPPADALHGGNQLGRVAPADVPGGYSAHDLVCRHVMGKNGPRAPHRGVAQGDAGLGRRVTITQGKKKAKIALEYYDQEDLEGLMQALSALDTGKERRKP